MYYFFISFILFKCSIRFNLNWVVVFIFHWSKTHNDENSEKNQQAIQLQRIYFLSTNVFINYYF